MQKKLSMPDSATKILINRAEERKVSTSWDRYLDMQPQCGFGILGLCCRNCIMGPCRIDPFGEGAQTGICGANADTITARGIARMVAGGSSAHSDHSRDVIHTLKLACDGIGGYSIKNEKKLIALAEFYGIDTKTGSIRDIALKLVDRFYQEFGQQHWTLTMAKRAPAKRQEIWNKLGIMPRGIDREVVEIMHRTTMGVDADYKNLIIQSMRCALADGWGGSMIATEVQDILFGLPEPLKAKVNMGVLNPRTVNIVVHGHEPVLSDVIAFVAQKPEIIKKAIEKGASGITVAGICCTANEILMRHGIPVAGNFLQQELAIHTGAVELMLVDVQCLMPSLVETAKCYHTKLVTTSPKGKIPGAIHIEFKEEEAEEIAERIIELAIENFINRDPAKVLIPDAIESLIAGFSMESIFHILGGTYRATYRPLNDAIIQGRIRGAVGIVGCTNPDIDYERGHIEMAKELLANDTLVVVTGCAAVACAKRGLLRPEAIYKFAGKGLKEVCEAVGIPPVLHLGSCVDNSRILIVLTEILKEGGLGDDISDLPAAGAAPEWMSEKAVAIGMYCVASGLLTVIGKPLPVLGSKAVTEYLTSGIEDDTGGRWAFEEDPVKAAHLILTHIDRKRKALKLKPMMYPQPFRTE